MRPRPALLLGLVGVLVAVAALAATRDSAEPTSATAVPGEGAAPPGPEASIAAAPTPAAPTPTPTPTATPIPREGSGSLTYAPGTSEPVGMPPYRPYAVATEDGSGVDPAALATFVERVLGDRRSWIGDNSTGFQRVGPDADPDFTIVVATPATVDELCAPLETEGRYSCGHNGWIALNLVRWMTATETWPETLEVYREYLINHEVGHYILGPDHPSCPAPGALAPIMVPQTVGLGGCRANGWVFPDD